MSTIQQMYCTHCTHGSSALERRQGELAARMLGYSVRAGSLEGETLRQVYRQVERYVSYHLPRDAPAEEKLRLSAASAPQRLIFIPAAGTWQVIGLVSYRPRDTEGRPGSYFAHLLCRELREANEAWTLVDALRLWKAPGWVVEDSPDHPFVLPAVADLDSMLGGEPARIDDRALLAFLQGDDRSFGADLPDRWRDLIPTRRVGILQNLVASLLTIGTTRRQTLLVAVEPEVAALLFYGMGRLIPPGKLRETVSVSTFEATTDRLTTVLAATTFCNPTAAEFRAEALRGRGLAVNTFNGLPPEDRNGSAYAERIVRRLLDDGPAAVDRRLATMAAAEPDRIEKLDEFARTEHSVAALFRSAGSSSDDRWRSDNSLTDFARRLTRERLEATEGAESTLNALCGGTSQATILELVGTVGPGSGADRAIRFLLERLPEEKIAAFVANPQIVDAWKIELLQSRIAATGRTPAGSAWIWSDDGTQSPLGPDRQKVIATGAIGDLPSASVTALLCHLDVSFRPVVMERLLEACGQRSERWSGFADLLRRFDVDWLIMFWRRLGSRLFEVPEPVGEVVSARLEEVLHTLHEHPAEFSQRLEFLVAGRRWLTSPSGISRLGAWERCREAIVELIGMKASLGGWHRLTATRRLEGAAERMTVSVLEAMPADLVEDDRQGSAKQGVLRAIGRHLADGEEFLPTSQWQYEAIWKKIRWRMEMGNWPSAPLRKLARAPAEQKRVWIAVAIAGAVVLGVLGVIGLTSVGTGNTRPDGLVIERRPGEGSPEPTPVNAGLTPERVPDQNAGASGVEPPDEPVVASAVNDSPQEPDPADAIVFRRDPGTVENTANQQEQVKSAAAEKPLISIPGIFTASMSPVSGLEPPAIAVVGLHVRGTEDQPLSRQLLQEYVMGALVAECRGAQAIRYLDFPDLQKRNEAELFDGVDKILVQFRFSRRPTDSVAVPTGIQATSVSWGEVLVDPAQRYDIRFVLSPQAVQILERLASENDPSDLPNH